MDTVATCNQLQEDEAKRLYCRIAVFRDGFERAITLDTCDGCEYGQLYREVQCPELDGSIDIIPMQRGNFSMEEYLGIVSAEYICRTTQRRIGPSDCRGCSVRDAAEVESLITETGSLLKTVGLEKALTDIDDARHLLGSPQWKPSDAEKILTDASAGLEETLKRINIAYGESLKGNEVLTDLWNTLKPKLNIDTRFNQLLDGSIRAFIRRISILRNKESRAHTSELTPSQLEARFYLNTVLILIDFIVRLARVDGKL